MILRREFLRRMAVAALACGFLELRLPSVVTRSFVPTCWIGDVGYETLADAFDDATTNTTIILGPAPWEPHGGVSFSTFPMHPPEKKP